MGATEIAPKMRKRYQTNELAVDSTEFGTRGSEVQILSPRPIFLQSFVVVSKGFVVIASSLKFPLCPKLCPLRRSSAAGLHLRCDARNGHQRQSGHALNFLSSRPHHSKLPPNVPCHLPARYILTVPTAFSRTAQRRRNGVPPASRERRIPSESGHNAYATGDQVLVGDRLSVA